MRDAGAHVRCGQLCRCHTSSVGQRGARVRHATGAPTARPRSLKSPACVLRKAPSPVPTVQACARARGSVRKPLRLALVLPLSARAPRPLAAAATARVPSRCRGTHL
eukprot:141912-Chlamydomonas_euryale.AAC.5